MGGEERLFWLSYGESSIHVPFTHSQVFGRQLIERHISIKGLEVLNYTVSLAISNSINEEEEYTDGHQN